MSVVARGPDGDDASSPDRRRRVLVTGGTGLIGSHVVERLVDHHDVHLAMRDRVEVGSDSITPWVVDLTDVDAVDDLVDTVRPHAICHLAGFVDGRATIDLVMPTLTANLVATAALLEAATTVGCERIVMAGSALDHATAGHTEPVPASPYAASRLASSAYARMFHALFGTPVAILRPSYVYGPRQRDRTKLVPHIISSLLDDRDVALTAGGRVIDWLYVGDAADAFVAALTADGIEGTTLDLASGDRHSVRAVAQMIHDTVRPPTAQLVFGDVPTRPMESDLVGDGALARERLGWQPTTPLDVGLSATVEWLRTRAGR